MNQFLKRTHIHADNLLHILRILSKNDYTINEIADKLHVSFVAVTYLLAELEQIGLVSVKEEKCPKNTKGRIPQLVKLKTQEFLTCAIDLSNEDIVVALYDLHKNEVVRETIADTYYIEQKHLEEIRQTIDRLLASKEADNRKLAMITIASPGMIGAETFRYKYVIRIKDFYKFNLQSYFQNIFNVPVAIYNDVNIACLAELQDNINFKNLKNSIFIHVGIFAGACLVINHHIFEGSNGYAGEFANYKEIDNVSTNNYANKFLSIEDIKKYYEELSGRNAKISDFNDIKHLLEIKDKTFISALDETIKRNAITLIGLNGFLDLDAILIEGPMNIIKDYYRKTLIKWINKYSADDFGAKILTSVHNEESCLKGAAYQSVDRFFIQYLENYIREKSEDSSYHLPKELYLI